MNIEEALDLAYTLLKKYNLENWKIELSRGKLVMGLCKYSIKTICLSRYLIELNDVSVVTNTILHEIAHALTPGHGHDDIWRSKALEIGCDGNRTCSTTKVNTPKGKYIGTCTNCKQIRTKHRKPDPKAVYCCNSPQCINKNAIIIWH